MLLRTTLPICLVFALAAAGPAFAEHTHTRYGEVIGNISRTNGGIIQRGPTHQLVGHLADAEVAALHLSALHARVAAATDEEIRAALARETGVWSQELAYALDRAATAARDGLTPDQLADRLADETDTDRRAALEQDITRRRAVIDGLQSLRALAVPDDNGTPQFSTAAVTQIGDTISNVINQVNTIVNNAVRAEDGGG